MLRTIRDAVRQSRLLSENKRLSALVEKQNEELKEWNASLKSRVLEQTVAIRKRSDELNDLNEKLKMNFEKSIASFASLLELRDKETKNHSRNVAKLSENMAKKMRLSVQEVDTIKIAALLHDIGKIGMSDKLLNMNAIGINLDGIIEYRNHPIRGQAAIDSIEDLREAGILIRSHHENYDGSGYPDKLQGGEIPVGSRIIAMADKFDHLLRKQQGDRTIEIPLDEIKSGLIKKFDSSLFPFLEIAAKEFYRKFSEEVIVTEMEIRPKDMQEGMVVSKDVKSGTGILLLCEGETLDQVKINAITRYYKIDPPNRGIYVKVYNEADS
jgi:putative nucleotidyltransferase with HDIG domain